MKENGTRLVIKVQPRSAKSKIVLSESNEIKAYLTSPPVDGKANAECIELFSEILSLAKSKIIIEKGAGNKTKRLLILGLSKEEIINRLKG